MSGIDELIAELAPLGSLYRRVGDVFVTIATPRGVKRSDYSLGTAIPIVDQGRSLVAGYTDNSLLEIAEGPYVVFGDHTRTVKWIDFPFAVGADGTKVLKANSGILPKYAYYATASLDIPDRGYNRHWTVVRDLRIPVPPVEIQREIVRVLDQFTKLEAELEAELEARRRQYAHYRDALVGAADSKSTAMGEIGTFVRGRRFTKSDVVDDGIPSIHYGEIYTDYGVSTSHANREVRSDMAGQLGYAQPYDVIFAGVGETVEDVGKAVAWLGDGPVAVHDDTFSFTSELDPKYVAYAVQTRDFQTQKANYVARGKVKRLSSAGLAKITIPVPSVAEQKRIVDLLDRFDALVNDPAFGLPAELAARRKQFKYYRNKLLTFEDAPE